MVKIEFPSDNKALAAALGRALVEYGEGQAVSSTIAGGVACGHEPQKSASEFKDWDNNGVEYTPADYPGPKAGGEVEEAREEMANMPTPEVLVEGDRDVNGVAFNGDYCGKADEPFYASGKRKGQWKKRRGVDDVVYDKWYAAERNPDDEVPAQTVNTASAFTPATPAAQEINTAGEFMVWVSEQMAAGHLTQAHINGAYTATGLQVADIMTNPDPIAVQANIAALRAVLTS